jgi:hypothetical protein
MDDVQLREQGAAGQGAEQHGRSRRGRREPAGEGEQDRHREERREVIGRSAQIAVEDEDAGEQEEARPGPAHLTSLGDEADAGRHTDQGESQHREFVVEGHHPAQGRLVEARHQERPGVHDATQVRDVLQPVGEERHDAPLARIVLRDHQVIPGRVAAEGDR